METDPHPKYTTMRNLIMAGKSHPREIKRLYRVNFTKRMSNCDAQLT